MADTPRVLVYYKIQGITLDPPLWVAVIDGTAADGGNGIVLAGPETRRSWRLARDVRVRVGENFTFGATRDLVPGTTRNVWGLDAAPPEIAAVWMKLQHTGKLVLNGQSST